MSVRPQPPPSTDQLKTLPFLADIPSLCVADGMVTRDSLRAASSAEHVQLIQRILQGSSQCAFSHFLTVPSTRCPIVRMLHVESDIRVDLSVNNRLV